MKAGRGYCHGRFPLAVKPFSHAEIVNTQDHSKVEIAATSSGMSIRQRVQHLEKQAAAVRRRTAPQVNHIIEVARLLPRLRIGSVNRPGKSLRIPPTGRHRGREPAPGLAVRSPTLAHVATGRARTEHGARSA
jgi:hypothetical protein